MLLKAVSSEVIGKWLEECLDYRFTDFGFVLQDTVNEVGRRLGFDVIHGVYRSHTNEGYDGLWRVPGGRAILVESKSSNSFSINLAGYRTTGNAGNCSVPGLHRPCGSNVNGADKGRSTNPESW